LVYILTCAEFANFNFSGIGLKHTISWFFELPNLLRSLNLTVSFLLEPKLLLY